MSSERLEKRVFLICPVRFADDTERALLMEYVERQEAEGIRMHYPDRDTNQEDPTGGYQICCDNSQAIFDADEVHIYWTEKSKGSLFDLGVAFNEHRQKGKPVRLVNRDYVEQVAESQRAEGVPKSFEMMLLRLDEESRNS
jgi:hypothetical protein